MASYVGEFEQLILLAVLRLGGGAYGVAIRRAIQQRTGQDVAAGALYTALGRLEGRGLVSSRVAESTPERSGRRRKYYRVEPAGAAALHRSVTIVGRMAEGLLPELEALAARAVGAGRPR